MLFRQNNVLKENDNDQKSLVDRIRIEQDTFTAALILRFSNLERQMLTDKMPKEKKEIDKLPGRNDENKKFLESVRLSKEIGLEDIALKNICKRVAYLQERYKDPEFEFWTAFAKFIFQALWKDHAPSAFHCKPDEFNLLVETMKKEGKKIPDGNCCEGLAGLLCDDWYLAELAKYNLHETLKMMFNNALNSDDKFSDFLLHTACDYLSLETVKVFFEKGANLNFSLCDPVFVSDGDFAPSPLFSVLFAGKNLRLFNKEQSIKPALELMKFLLENGADPDLPVYIPQKGDDFRDMIYEEFQRSTRSIREFCLDLKYGDNYPKELIEMVIEAPKKTLSLKI